MTAYPFPARIFIATLWMLGLLATLMTLALPQLRGEKFEFEKVAPAVLLAALAGSRKIRLTRATHDDESGSMTLGFLITFTSLLAFGVQVGVVVGIVSGVSAGLFPRRQSLHQSLFNISNIAASVWIAGHALFWLNGRTLELTWDSPPAVFAATLVYFVFNTGCVASIIALCSGEWPGSVWRKNFLWTLPSYLAGASFAFLGGVLFQLPTNLNRGTWLLAAPILAFTYQLYRARVDNADQRERYIQELKAGQQTLSELYLATVRSLASAINAKDHYTHEHIQRVHGLTMAMADRMGLDEASRHALSTGALLHDIGKLGVPDYVLLKPGPLSPEEYEKMKRHAVIGAEILAPVPFPWPVVGVVRHHHEKWDGSGYPDGLSGVAIPLGARILAVADVFDALTSDRPYRPGWPWERAVAHIRDSAGVHFDPGVVKTFVEVVETMGVREAMESGHTSAGPVPTRHIRRTTSELWSLYEVTNALSVSQDMRRRLDAVADIVSTLVPGSLCAVLLHSRPSGFPPIAELPLPPPHALRLWVAGLDERNPDAPHEVPFDSVAARTLRHGRPYRGPIRMDEFCLSAFATFEPHSALIVPLTALGESLGVLSLYHPKEDAFTEDDEHLLTLIAAQVQSAIQQDALLDRTRKDALTDSLTGLYNARYLSQSAEFTRTPDGAPVPCALLCLDLDNFKTINDIYGHQKGNDVLRDIAALFPTALRPRDLVVRYGGDEFLILLPDTDRVGAERVSARVRQAVQDYDPGLRHPQAGDLRLDVSIGIACGPEDGRDLNALVAAADQRMYAEKASHKFNHSTRPSFRMVAAGDNPISSAVEAIVHTEPKASPQHTPTAQRGK